MEWGALIAVLGTLGGVIVSGLITFLVQGSLAYWCSLVV